LRSWASRRTDPIPYALTVLGLVLSAFAAGWGVAHDWQGFALNLSASLAIVGPALFLSNVIVKYVQAARAEVLLKPMLLVVLTELNSTVNLVHHACDMLGLDLPNDPPPSPVGMDRATFVAVRLDNVARALRDAQSALTDARTRRTPPSELSLKAPIVFPRFRLMLSMVEQMHRMYPMPETVVGVAVTEDGSAVFGMRIIRRSEPDGAVSVQRAVGFMHIAHQSAMAGKHATIDTERLLTAVDFCLDQSLLIAEFLRQELPPHVEEVTAV